MTLVEWVDRFQWAVYNGGNDCIAIPVGPGDIGHFELYGLSDYKVSSCCGGITYLVESEGCNA
jgi:hypothetical protein